MVKRDVALLLLFLGIALGINAAIVISDLRNQTADVFTVGSIGILIAGAVVATLTLNDKIKD